MVETPYQLAFWPPASRHVTSDDWPVLRSAVWSNSTRQDDIAVGEESFPDNLDSARDIVLLVGSTNWTKGSSRSKQMLAKAAPATIAALIRIAFAQRETLSLDRLSVREHAVKRLIALDVEAGRARVHAGSLANSYMRISHEVFRHDLVSAWMRTLARVPHHAYEVKGFLKIKEKSDRFIPSAALVEIVKDGLRSHSENYPRLVEPKFLPSGLALLRDEDIRDFIAIRMSRLMLSLADHAAAEGKDELQLGSKSGFLDKVDHLILDRIPVPPKNVTPFLITLYEEYKHFARGGQVLPGRGQLWSDEEDLFLKLDESAFESLKTEVASNQKTEVIFE